MASKARRNEIPHLLIDRFRFDSFAAKSTLQGSNLLTRFGSKVYMTYVITPPHSTVERAWKRGLQVGRYKSADDLLDHNVEAFNGMPQIFFTWAKNSEKDVYHEFLDNSVPLGERPRTVAFGRNDRINILDLDKIMDINRFQKININATGPDEVYSAQPDSETRFQFLSDCLQQLQSVTFCDHRTGTVYARKSGTRVEVDDQLLQEFCDNPDHRSVLITLLQEQQTMPFKTINHPRKIELDYRSTLGRWGTQRKEKDAD